MTSRRLRKQTTVKVNKMSGGTYAEAKAAATDSKAGVATMAAATGDTVRTEC